LLDWLRPEKRTESLADLDARMDAMANGGYGDSRVFVSDIAALNLATVFNAATIRCQ
jgi:hypothetical protein